MINMNFVLKCCGLIFIGGIPGIQMWNRHYFYEDFFLGEKYFQEGFFFDSKFRDKEAQKIKS